VVAFFAFPFPSCPTPRPPPFSFGRPTRLGARTVFLEVDKHNAAAGKLYRRAGFYEVGQRQGYYGGKAAALVLRRDLG
jgi:ribosomal protein S18 acetylase RimI-like enzyme